MLIVRSPRTLDFDRMFDQLTSGWVATPQRRDRTPAVHGEWRDDTLVLRIRSGTLPIGDNSASAGAESPPQTRSSPRTR